MNKEAEVEAALLAIAAAACAMDPCELYDGLQADVLCLAPKLIKSMRVLREALAAPKLRPIEDWTQDDGSVLWYRVPVDRDPRVATMAPPWGTHFMALPDVGDGRGES